MIFFGLLDWISSSDLFCRLYEGIKKELSGENRISILLVGYFINNVMLHYIHSKSDKIK